MDHGVVVLEGEKPADGTVVDVTPAKTIAVSDILAASHPALGMWKDRTDLPEDSLKASRTLRERMMRRTE